MGEVRDMRRCRYSFGVILLFTLAMGSVMAYYPGETYSFPNEMGLENLVYTIIGNSSPVSPLDIAIDSENITITFPADMIPDSFEIVFLENQTHEVIQTIYRGGGGTRTKYVDRNVTSYVPEYINVVKEVVKEVEVEKIIDNTIEVEEGYGIWHLIFVLMFGLCLGLLTRTAWNSKEKDDEIEETYQP